MVSSRHQLIRHLYRTSDVTQIAIARQFGITRQAVHQVVRDITKGHIRKKRVHALCVCGNTKSRKSRECAICRDKRYEVKREWVRELLKSMKAREIHKRYGVRLATIYAIRKALNAT